MQCPGQLQQQLTYSVLPTSAVANVLTQDLQYSVVTVAIVWSTSARGDRRERGGGVAAADFETSGGFREVVQRDAHEEYVKFHSARTDR